MEPLSETCRLFMHVLKYSREVSAAGSDTICEVSHNDPAAALTRLASAICSEHPARSGYVDPLCAYNSKDTFLFFAILP